MTDAPKGGHAHERPSVTDPATVARHAEYWRRNIRYLGALTAVWFIVSPRGRVSVLPTALPALVLFCQLRAGRIRCA